MNTRNITDAELTENAEVNLLVDDNGELKKMMFRKKNEAISVKRLGARGDGVTDDTNAIAAAFSGAYQSVYIPAGTYMISRQIDIGSDIHVFDDGEISVIKLKAGSGEVQVTEGYPEPHRKINALNVSGRQNIFLSSFCIDGNKEGYDANPEGLEVCSRKDHVVCAEFQNSSNIKLDGMAIRGSLIEGAYFYKCSDVLVTHCIFKENGYTREDASGIHCDGANSNVVIGSCISRNNGFHGFLFSQIDGLAVSNCVADSNGYEGFLFQYGAEKCVVSNCVSKHNGRYGVQVKNECKNVQMSNISVLNNGGSGILLNGIELFQASNIRIANSEGFGLYVCAASRCELSRVSTSQNVLGEVFVVDALANVTVDSGSSVLGQQEEYDDWGTVGTKCVIEPADIIDRITDPDKYAQTGGGGEEMNPVMEVGGLDRNTGNGKDNAGYSRTAEFIPVRPNVDYTLSNTAGNKVCLMCYDSNKQSVADIGNGSARYIYVNSGDAWSFSERYGIAFIKFYVSSTADLSIQYSVSWGASAAAVDPTSFKKLYFPHGYSLESGEIDPGLYQLVLKALENEFNIFAIKAPEARPHEATIALGCAGGNTNQFVDFSCMKYREDEQGQVCIILQKRGDTTPLPFFILGLLTGLGRRGSRSSGSTLTASRYG